MAHDNETEFTQHVASNATGHQSYYSGQGHQINNGSGTINNYNGAYPDTHESREKIIQALYTSPYLQRKNRNPDRVPGTCEWFLNHGDFHHWRDITSSSLLLVSANPGCGKSVLAKCLVDELKTKEQKTVCYFFFKDDFEDQRSAKGALSCILHQLFIQREGLFSAEIMKRFKSYKTPLANSYYELWELWDILVMASQETDIICILDAFDECDNQEQQDLTKIVREFYVQSGSTKQGAKLKFLITGRPYDTIRQGLIGPLNLQDFPIIHLKGDGDTETEQIAGEISLYIKERVSRVRTNLDLTEKEEELLLQGLRAVPNQTYLWVYLTLEWIETEICNKISEMEIRNAISILPRTVDEAYDKILAKSTNANETKKLLHIVVAAERPLSLAEMELALTLQPHHKTYKDIDQRPSDRFKKYIRDLCGLFINIRDEKIYLLHQTAKEFLVPRGCQDSQEDIVLQRTNGSQTNHHKQPTWRSSLIASESHLVLFKVCVWYLLFTEFETFPFSEEKEMADYLHEHLFLEYSAQNWAAHFRASNIKENEFIEQLQQICDPNSTRFLIWFKIYWAEKQTEIEIPLNFTMLMVASYFGVESIVRLQLQSLDIKLDAVDSTHGRSALSWAADNGFESIVVLLIRGPKFTLRRVLKNSLRLSFTNGATIDAKDKSRRTPLLYAVLNGHLSVVRILVKAGAHADLLDDPIGGTPISYALCTGRQDIANELTRSAPNISVDALRDLVLLSATENGHQPIVKLLLDNGADIEAVGKDKKTPLIIALSLKNWPLAQFLLERGAAVKPDKGDYSCHFLNDSGCDVEPAISNVEDLLVVKKDTGEYESGQINARTNRRQNDLWDYNLSSMVEKLFKFS